MKQDLFKRFLAGTFAGLSLYQRVDHRFTVVDCT